MKHFVLFSLLFNTLNSVSHNTGFCTLILSEKKVCSLTGSLKTLYPMLTL